MKLLEYYFKQVLELTRNFVSAMDISNQQLEIQSSQDHGRISGNILYRSTALLRNVSKLIQNTTQVPFGTLKIHFRKKLTISPFKNKSKTKRRLVEEDASLASKLALEPYKFRSTLVVAQLCKMAPNAGPFSLASRVSHL